MAIRVDPNTGAFIPVNLRVPQQPMLGPPIRRQTRVRFGDIPNITGGPGNLVSPYDESEVWNQNDAPAMGTPPPPTGMIPTEVTPTANGSWSAPFGEAGDVWRNPTTFATVPVNAATNINQPVLSQNSQRNALIIQNGSTATVAGDVAPIMYIGFNAQPQVGAALALQPGVGVAFDIITPRDSIYIAFGPFVNTGGSVVIQGAVIQGTYAP